MRYFDFMNEIVDDFFNKATQFVERQKKFNEEIKEMENKNGKITSA